MAYKTLNQKQHAAVECEVKLMLHASRDCMRNLYTAGRSVYNPKKVRFVAADGYYGEAFGVMRGLVALGYGFFGADNGTEAHNLKAWFSDICRRVMEEEHFGGSGECDFCYKYYGRDDSRRKPDVNAQVAFRTEYKALRKKLGLEAF